METRDRGRLDAAAIHVQVAEITFQTKHEPFPLEIVTGLATRNETRFLVARAIVSHQVVSVQIRVRALTPLSSQMQTNVKALPVARRRNGRDDLIFVIAHWLGSGECHKCQSCAGEKNDQEAG